MNVDSSVPPVPAPRSKTVEKMKSSSSTGKPSSQTESPPGSSSIPTSHKVKMNHPWMAIIHPGPWTQLPPAPAPMTPPRSSSSPAMRGTWFKPRAMPSNPFGDMNVDTNEDARKEATEPEAATQSADTRGRLSSGDNTNDKPADKPVPLKKDAHSDPPLQNSDWAERDGSAASHSPSGTSGSGSQSTDDPNAPDLPESHYVVKAGPEGSLGEPELATLTGGLAVTGLAGRVTSVDVSVLSQVAGVDGLTGGSSGAGGIPDMAVPAEVLGAVPDMAAAASSFGLPSLTGAGGPDGCPTTVGGVGLPGLVGAAVGLEIPGLDGDGGMAGGLSSEFGVSEQNTEFGGLGLNESVTGGLPGGSGEASSEHGLPDLATEGALSELAGGEFNIDLGLPGLAGSCGLDTSADIEGDCPCLAGAAGGMAFPDLAEGFAETAGLCGLSPVAHSLPKGVSVPALSSAIPHSPSVSSEQPEKNHCGGMTQSKSKACKGNPFDRKSAIPKSETFQATPSRRAPAPGYGFPPIKRKVQTDPFLPTEDLQVEMGKLNERLEALELRGVRMEKELRDCKNEKEEEEMLLDWMTLVHEKHVLVRRDTELVHLAKQKKLEERQEDLEYELRCVLIKPESEWSAEDRSHEHQLMDQLVTVIEERNQIISSLDQDRQREKEEDIVLDAMMEKKDLQKEGLKELKKSKGRFKPMKVFKMLSAKEPKEKKS